jgi:predicted phage terminase large subunit-like protein
LAQRAASLTPSERAAWLSTLTEDEARSLLGDWRFWARPEQVAPPGDWLVWLILAGRGWGKTRSGAEFILDAVMAGHRRGALVARTAADARDVMVEGESGLIACAERRGLSATYEPSKRRVVIRLADGSNATLTTYSAEEPDQLRGPQHDIAWADELAAWPNKTDALGNSAWSNLLMGLRLGTRPQVVVTTTPRNTQLVREILKAPNTQITRGSTFDNIANLAPSFRDLVIAKYEGTRLGRQELFAELLEDVDGALWTLAQIDALRIDMRERPELTRIVVAIDPPATSTGAECGIVVAGYGRDEHGYVLDDRSRRGTPDQWARAALQAYIDHGADELVIETNQGGDMAENTLKTTAQAMAAEGAPTRTVKVKRVHASRGKRARAEPVSALYEQGRVHHVGAFTELEDQMTTWTPDATSASPDRMDALVWAITRLMLEPRGATFREW